MLKNVKILKKMQKKRVFVQFLLKNAKKRAETQHLASRSPSARCCANETTKNTNSKSCNSNLCVFCE